MRDEIQVIIISIGPYSCQVWPETGGQDAGVSVGHNRLEAGYTWSVTGLIKTPDLLL